MPPVLNIPGFWIAQDSEYVSGSECAIVLDIPGFWICLWFWMCQDSEYKRVLNMVCIHKVTQGSKYIWIIPEYAWMCLILPGFIWICLNMPEYAWICLNGLCFTFLNFPISLTIPSLLEHVITYLNVYRRLEVIVWRNMRQFSWIDNIWFFLWQQEVFLLFFVLD